MTERNNQVTGYHLKLIALLTMFIDHLGAVVLMRMIDASFFSGESLELVQTIYEYMRLIGRIAFPIYCFLIVEGFLHTRSVKKYAMRLLAFALISEIPFDMALTGAWWNPMYNNVFFTLLLGLIVIWGISYVEKFYEFWVEKNWDLMLGKMLTFLVGGTFALTFGLLAEMVLYTDYGMAGVFAILVLYLFRKNREIGFIFAVLLLSIFTSSTEIMALLALWPLMKYDGSRGKKTKYFFYIFYPAHLLLFAIICMGIHV